MNCMIIDLNDINLTRKEVYVLALLLNRLTWSQLRACAVDEAQAYLIRDAVYKLQKALAEAGFPA